MSSTAGAIDRRQPAPRAEIAVRQLSAAISLVLLGLIVSLAMILLARRLSGALVTPLSGGGVLLAVLAIESAIAVYRCCASRTEYLVLSTQYLPRWSRSLPPRAVFSLITPGLAALAILSSLTIHGTPAWGLTLAWLFLVAAESIQWPLYLRPDLINIDRVPASAVSVASASKSEQPEIPSGLIQQLTRTLAGDQESIHAIVSAEIAARDRLAAVHLSFCPPLAAPPQLAAHAIDADDADVRITQTETFGARLEVRLPAANDMPRRVLVEVLGSVTARRIA